MPDPDPLADWLVLLDPIYRHLCDQFESSLLAWERAAHKATTARIDGLREEAVATVMTGANGGGEGGVKLIAALSELIERARSEQKEQIVQYGTNREMLDALRQPTPAFQNPASGRRSMSVEYWPKRTVWSVVHADLVAFQPLADLYRRAAPERAARLGGQLRDLFDAACRDVAAAEGGRTCPPPDRCCYRDEDTGDGCIYLFASPEHACRFAERVHRWAVEYNRRECPEPDQFRYRWWFRVGIETGVARFVIGGGRNDGNAADGAALVGAARITPAAPPGGVVINPATRDALPDGDLRDRFAARRDVPDKHDLPPREVYEWVVDAGAVAEFRQSGR